MTFEKEFCPTCGVIDCMVVKSPPMPPPLPGWGEVGPYFDRCIITKIDERKVLSRRLRRLQEHLSAADKAINTLSGGKGDSCRLKQHDEQLRDYKADLSNVSLKLMSLDLDESDDLLKQHFHLEELMFTCMFSSNQGTDAFPHIIGFYISISTH